jgi:divalent metal cation (Fe/Co/Zn/Cd) transporter
LIIALAMLPVPLIGLWRSLADVLQVAPHDLVSEVHSVMDSIVRERTFVDYSSYVAKVGRARFVEIHVLVAPDSRIDTAAADAIRRDIAQRLNAVFPNFWLIAPGSDPRCSGDERDRVQQLGRHATQQSQSNLRRCGRKRRMDERRGTALIK